MVACVQGLFHCVRQGLVYSVYGLNLKNCLLYRFSLQESIFYLLPILPLSLQRSAPVCTTPILQRAESVTSDKTLRVRKHNFTGTCIGSATPMKIFFYQFATVYVSHFSLYVMSHANSHSAANPPFSPPPPPPLSLSLPPLAVRQERGVRHDTRRDHGALLCLWTSL